MIMNMGVPVYSKTGEKGPPLERVIVEPREWQVQYLVTGKGEGINNQKLVPISLVENWANDKVVIRLSLQELKDMPDYLERQYATPRQLLPSAKPAGWDANKVPSKQLFTQEGIPYGPGIIPHETSSVEGHGIPVPEPVSGPIQLSDGILVEAVDGPVGKLDSLLLEVYEDRISSLVLSETEAGVELRVPVEWIAYLDPQRIRLAALKDQVRKLIAPPAGNYLSEYPEGNQPSP